MLKLNKKKRSNEFVCYLVFNINTLHDYFRHDMIIERKNKSNVDDHSMMTLYISKTNTDINLSIINEERHLKKCLVFLRAL